MRSALLGETGPRLETQAATWDVLGESPRGGDLVQASARGRSKRALELGTCLVVVRDDGGRIADAALMVLKRLAPRLCAGSVAREALERALRLVLDSMDRRERSMRLVYGNSKAHDLVMGLGRFRPSGRVSLGWRPSREWARTQRVQFYEVARAPAPRPVAGR